MVNSQMGAAWTGDFEHGAGIALRFMLNHGFGGAVFGGHTLLTVATTPEALARADHDVLFGLRRFDLGFRLFEFRLPSSHRWGAFYVERGVTADNRLAAPDGTVVTFGKTGAILTCGPLVMAPKRRVVFA